MGQTIPHKWWLDFDEECARVDEWGTYQPRPRWNDPQDACIEDAPRWALELLRPPADGPDPIRDVMAGLDELRRRCEADNARLLALLGIPLSILKEK